MAAFQKVIYDICVSMGHYIDKETGETKSSLLKIGVGYQNLEDEQFMPIYLLLIGKRKVGRGPYIESSIGYSYGRNSKYEHAVMSSFEGGKYFSTGIGYGFNINNQYTFLASCNYIMQQSQVKHYEGETVNYIEDLIFDLIVFKVGLLLK